MRGCLRCLPPFWAHTAVHVCCVLYRLLCAFQHCDWLQVCVCVYARACMCIQHPPPSLPPSLPLSLPPSAEKALVWTCCWSGRLTASATCSSTMPHSPRGPCSCNKTGLTTDRGQQEGLSGQDCMGPSGIIPPVTATVYTATH